MAKGDGTGERLRSAMVKANYRAVDLARAVGVKEPTVNGWLDGRHGLKWANAKKAAKFLSVSAGWLMFGGDETAEGEAQNKTELLFLRQLRELDDADQMQILRQMTNTSPSDSPAPNVAVLNRRVRAR